MMATYKSLRHNMRNMSPLSTQHNLGSVDALNNKMTPDYNYRHFLIDDSCTQFFSYCTYAILSKHACALNFLFSKTPKLLYIKVFIDYIQLGH